MTNDFISELTGVLIIAGCIIIPAVIVEIVNCIKHNIKAKKKREEVHKEFIEYKIRQQYRK